MMFFVSGTLIGLCLSITKGHETYHTYAAHQNVDAGIQLKTKQALQEQEPISIVFAGDTLFDWSVRKAIHQFGPDYPFEYVKDEVSRADYAILNLETAVTKRAEKDPVQLYNFKSDPIALEGIKNAGFDMVSLANNHALDYQVGGLLDTIEHLNSYEIKYFGAGRNKQEAYRAQRIEINGKKISILGFSRFLPAVRWYENEGPVIASAYQQERVLDAIDREGKDADYVIIYIHWGVEKNNRPENWQRQFAYDMIDRGADAIVGSHPHVLQGFEYYNGKPIAYSLGNFLFPDYVKGKTAQTGLLTLTIDGDISMQFNPFVIRTNQIHPLEGEDDQEVFEYLEQLSYGVSIEEGIIQSNS